LRQDMLVLQVLELMDSVWKRNHLDCCLSTYPYGMIGVVPNCSTIFEIQSEGGKVLFCVIRMDHKTCVFRYMECVDRFLMSCVGYSVATFIMGIMDRHNDNIMMTHDGKLFHIDFGHILGHGKTKLGIRRDRVPFVLTEHFLCVIGQGRPSMELPELSTEADLDHLKVCLLFTPESTLRVAYHDGMTSEARSFFAEIFDEAFNGSWATKTNWFFHAVKHI
uniref:PI3K/PI4K domain-containing protein n=1 Tax=Heligmosomoides polygyrus TaxID=6339 RepID=A0A183FK06_HELPZ